MNTNRTITIMEIEVQEYRAQDLRLATYLKALAHPARLSIFRLLCESKSCICGEIVDRLPLAQATVSQHLKAMKDAGIIQGEISGPRTCYCLNPAAVEELRHMTSDLFDACMSTRSGSQCC